MHLITSKLNTCLAVATATLALGINHANAADKTWDGGGDGVNWSASPANWVGDVAPVANDSLFFNGTTGLNPNNDFAASTAFGGITFNSGAGAFVMTGNEINLAGGVTNLSSNPQTLSMNLNQTANRSHYALTNMTYDGVMKNNALLKYGPGTITLAGSTGNSSLRAEVYDGVLVLAKTSGNALGSSPIVASGTGVLRITGPGTDQIHFNQRVVVTNGGIFQIQNSFEEIGAISGSNSLTGVIENGLASTTNRLDIGGGSGHEGIYSGSVRDGAGVLNLQIYRNDNKFAFNGTHTYSGTTAVNNTAGTGYARMIMNGTHVGGGAYTINGHASTVDRLAALGGSGIISASVVNFNVRGVLSPGGAISADLTDSANFLETTAVLTFSNAVNLTAAASTLEVQLNGTTPGSGYDQVAIKGSGSFSNNSANLNFSVGYAPVVGDKFTLVMVQGTDSANNLGVFATLNGVAADLSQGATFIDPGSGKYFQISYRAEGSTFDMGAGLGNDIMLQVVAAPGANLTWRGDMSYAWDVATTANWRTSGNASTTFGVTDNAIFDNSGSNAAPINLTTGLTPGNITIDSTNNYIFATSTAGNLTGTVVLVKTNTGTLTMLTDNNNAGSTIINAGKLQVGTNSTTGTLSGSLTVNANGILEHNRSDDVTLATPLAGTGAFVHTGSGALILSANSPFTGHTTNSGGMLQIGTGGTDGSIGGDVSVVGASLLRYYYGGDVNIGNTRSGNGTIIYEAASGNRTFTIPITVVSSNFTGSNVLTAGVRLHCSDNNNGYNIGNGGSVSVSDFAQVWLDRSATPYNQEFFLAGNGFVGDATPLGAMRIFGCTVSGPVHFLANTRFGGSINGGSIIGKIDGDYQLEIMGTANSFILSLSNSANAWGNTLVTSGAIRALAAGSISTNAMTLDLNGELNVFGNTVAVNSLNNGGSGAGVVYNKSTTSSGTLVVGADGSGSSFDGIFGDGASQPLNLTKVGAGTLTLSAVNTNTGTVAVNGGTLALTGSGSFGNAAVIAAGNGGIFDVSGIGGTLTLNSGQTLKGSGTVNGTVSASAGSTVNPGDSIGTLTVSGNLTLAGTLRMELNRTNSVQTNDLISVAGTLTTTGGTLTVSNTGPALAVGNFFQLFSAGRSFAAVNLQTNDVVNNVKYTWTDTINSNGRITVAGVTTLVNATPTNIVSKVNGSNLELSWPADHTGWTLQVQTNNLNIGLATNWVAVPGSTLVNSVTNPINPANGSVFYRLILP